MTRSRGRRRSAPRTTYCYRSGRIHPGGFVTATSAGLKGARTDQVSRHCNGVFPLARRFGSENPERRSRDEMALKVEVIVDGGMHAQKALGGSSRFERCISMRLSVGMRIPREVCPNVMVGWGLTPKPTAS